MQEAIERQKRNITTIVFDFNPRLASATSDWNSPNRLAEYIRNLQQGTVPGKNYPNIATFAFIQNLVSKHTVLPALACKQIIMSSEVDPRAGQIKARLGGVTRELGGFVGETARSAYVGVARNFASPDLIMRMLEPDLVIKRVKTTDGPCFLSEQSMRKLEKSKQPFTVDDNQPEALRRGNDVFDAQQALELGLSSGIKNSPAELATALHLPRKSLTEDWLLVHETVYPWRIEVRGPLDKGKLEAIERRLKEAVGRGGANLLILQLSAEAGETKHVASTAQMIRNLRDDNELPVKTVAYVPPGCSLGAATFLALACNEIVMAKDAVLADFAYLPEDQRDDVKAMLVPLAKEQGYPPLLFEASLTKGMVLYWAKTKDGEDRVITEKERKGFQGQKISRLEQSPEDLLKINAPLAGQFQIAQATNIDTLDALYDHYDLKSDRVRIAARRLARKGRRVFPAARGELRPHHARHRRPHHGTQTARHYRARCDRRHLFRLVLLGVLVRRPIYLARGVAVRARPGPDWFGDFRSARLRFHRHQRHRAADLEPGAGHARTHAADIARLGQSGRHLRNIWHEPGRRVGSGVFARLVFAEHSVRQPLGFATTH